MSSHAHIPWPTASRDMNKIIGADYSLPFCCDLAYKTLEARTEWPELKPCYHQTGCVMIDEQGIDLAERLRKVFRKGDTIRPRLRS